MIRSTFTLLLILNLCFLVSCSDRDDELQNTCIEISQNPEWNTEDFKTNFTIQFPDNYEGVGMTGFEGNFFRKYRSDERIEFDYRFCSATYCYDFGNPLDMPIPNSITAKDRNQKEKVLSSKKEFCSNSDTIGYFYFDEEESSTGKYFMKRDSVYLEGLTIYFSATEIQEVENLIKTIVEK